MTKPSFDGSREKMYRVNRCFNCPNAVIDLDQTEKIINLILQAGDINRRLKERLNTEKPLHHQMLHLAIAGCPNSCSQPQIKDFGVQGQAVPEIHDGCIFCEQCVQACPDDAISLKDTGPVIDTGRCLNCAKCVQVCPSGTLRTGKTGYRIMLGGKVGRHPRFATVINPLADNQKLKKSLSLALDFWLERSRPGERMGQLLERTGEQVLIEYINNKILEV